jgi:hypothetical protein
MKQVTPEVLLAFSWAELVDYVARFNRTYKSVAIFFFYPTCVIICRNRVLMLIYFRLLKIN